MILQCCTGAPTRRGLAAALIAVFTAIVSSDEEPWQPREALAAARAPQERPQPAPTAMTARTLERRAAVRRIRLRAALGDGFVTEAELTLPADAGGPVPAVLLIHGATPADMDFTTLRRGADTTRVFLEIADSLAARGIGSLRYHKRWVTGPGRFDQARFFRTDLQALLADARVMLDTLRAQPTVDRQRLVVWGWSEGSAIAAQLAAHDGALAGVVAHGPVVTSFGETLRGQFRRVGVPYLLRFAAPDSTLDLAAITRAEQGDGGLLVRSHATILLDPFALQRGERRLNGLVDPDSSGRIHVTREALAVYERMMQGPMLGMYGEGRALPGWRVMADSVRIPLLVLQGEADANIPVGDVRALEAQLRGRPRAAVRIYPALGHSLGAAPDPEHDDFRPVDAAPLRDAAAWISALAPAGRPAASPAAPRGR